MMKMQLKYAEEFLVKGRSGHYLVHSCHDNLLVIEDLEDYYNAGYLGTRLKNEKLEVDELGYVTFRRVTPVIDENTKWKF